MSRTVDEPEGGPRSPAVAGESSSGLSSRPDIKHYSFTVTEKEHPFSEWRIGVRIDETVFEAALSKMAGNAITLQHADAFLLAIDIVHRKTRALLKNEAGERELLFSAFEIWKPEREPDAFGYEKGGLGIVVLAPASK